MTTKTQELKNKIKSLNIADRHNWVRERLLIDDIYTVIESWGETTCLEELNLIPE